MPLSKETHSRIGRDAIDTFPMGYATSGNGYRQKGYIEGATVEAERAQLLEEALEERDATIHKKLDEIEKEVGVLEDKLGAAIMALKEIESGTDFPRSIAQNTLIIINTETT